MENLELKSPIRKKKISLKGLNRFELAVERINECEDRVREIISSKEQRKQKTEK